MVIKYSQRKVVSLNLCAVMDILLLYILSRFANSEQNCYFLYKTLQNRNLCVPSLFFIVWVFYVKSSGHSFWGAVSFQSDSFHFDILFVLGCCVLSYLQWQNPAQQVLMSEQLTRSSACLINVSWRNHFNICFFLLK